MKYITRNGEAFESPERSGKTLPVLVGCAVGIGIGLGLRLLAESHPEVVVGILSTLADVATAIWHMLCDIANACSLK